MSHNKNSNNDNNSSSLGVPKPAGAGGDRLSLIAQGRGVGASNENSGINNKSKPWRSTYTDELPLNDVNASASIDVSARLGLKPSAEPTISKASNNNNNTTAATAATKASPASPTNTGEGKLTLKDLQGVFSSSLVSAASLDFLRVNTVVADDYADTKTLSSTVKWILQAQELSDILLSASKTGVGANKGIISWAEFLHLADPFLRAPDRNYMRAHKTQYNQPINVPVEEEEENSGSGSGSGGDSRESSSKATAGHKAEAKDAVGSLRSSLSQSQQKENIRNNNSKLRSRGSFKSSSSSDEREEEQDSDNNNTGYKNNSKIKQGQHQQQQQTKNILTSLRDTGHTSRFASNKGSAASTSYRDDHEVADLEEVEEMELAEDPRRVSNNYNNNNSKGSNIRGSNSYKRSNSSDSEEEGDEETDRRYGNTASTNNNNSKGNRVSQFDNNINRRRQWEDPDVTDDNISITSGVQPAPVRRVSGNVNTSFGASALTRQTSQNKNSVFDLDLLDDSVASIPLMNDQSHSFEKPSNNNAHAKHSSAVNKSVDRGMPMHNSFDDVSSSDEDHRRAVVVKQQRESPIEDGTDNANNNDRPLSSSFVSDSDEADSFKMPPRHTNTHFTAQAGAGAGTGASVNRSHPSESANRSLLANSFDEEDEEEQYNSDGEEEKEGREGREQKHRTQPPLVGRSNSHIQQQQQQVQDVDQENEHDTEGGLDGAPPIKKKTGVKKFMKMFSLTSTSASSKSSVNNSQTSSVHGSPLRHRANSNESEHTVNSLNTSTLDNTTLNAAAPKSKSMFGRMKSSVSKPFKSSSTSSNKEGVSGSGKSDAGSETGSQISAADYAALHADRTERGRLDSIDSTDSAQINAHSALDDSTGGPSGKVKKNMLGRITSKMSKPFKSSNSSNRSDAGSETGSQISGTENIAEQYRDQQRDTADSKKMAKDKAAIATTTAATAAAAPVSMAERDRTDSIDSESHLEGVPSGKVKKNMLGRITSKMSKPFKSSNSSNRSDAGSETGSQASAVEYAAILDERTSHSSGTATAGAMGATERARGNSLDSTDSAHINNESHLEGVPSGKVKKNMLGRITSKMSKPFKSSNSSNRSDAGSETGSQMSTPDQAAVATDLAASGTAATTVPPSSAKPYTTPITTAATAVAVASPPKPPKPVPSTVPAKASISAPTPGPAPAPAGPKYASYASALAHQPTDTSDRARASSFDSTDSAMNAHIEGLPSSSGAKDTDSAITKPKKSVLGRVASKMSKPFKAGTNKSESNRSDNGSEVGSQISEQEQQTTSRAAPDRSALVSSQGSAPLTAAALNQRATSSDTAPASGPHSQLPLPRLERVSSLDSTSTHDQTGQPKLKKGMFGRITSKLSKPFKSGKSGTSSAGSAHDGEEMSETGSQISAEERSPPSTSTAAPVAPSRTHLTSLKQPVSVMESVDLDSPVSGKAGSSGKYSIGIADSARDSHDHDAYSSSNTPDSVPIFTNTTASPTTIANVSSSRLPPTPRTHRAASDAASEEGSVNSAHTHETTSSMGSKKGKPTLKGMMHKSYKVVFQGNKKSSATENAGDDAFMSSLGAVLDTTAAAAPVNSTTVEPPEKPAKLPFRFKKAGERQTVEEIAGDNTGTNKPASPPKPLKPAALSASHSSHPMPHASHLNPVPQPTSPTIYSAEDIIAGMHSAAPASRPLPAVPTTNANNDVSASQSDVITADRRLSNPALNKKRSSFSLGGLFGFGSSGSKENSRNSSRAPSRSNSFNGDADLTSAAAAGGGNNNSGGNRESVNHRPHSTRDPSPQRSFNGTGLAALLRGQVPSPSPLSGRFVDRSESTPMSPLTPTTPYVTQSYDTNYDPAANNQQTEEQAALEMSNVLLESSRLASQSILNRVQAQQSKFIETHQHPHTVNVLADLQQIKQNRAKSQDRARVSSHHHRHLDDHNRIGSDLDDSDIEDQDGNTSVSSPAQRKLLLDWKSIVSRRAPQSVFLTSDSLAEMRQLVRTSRGDDVQVDLIALDDADEDAIHRQKRRMMSTVPDPLFGLSLHDKAALSHLRLTKSLKHSSNHSQNASLSLKPVNAADLTTAQLNKLVQENAFYSELDLAMGVKFSGQLSRVVSRFWRHRYFVLMVEPLINPNLFPQGGPKEESVPASAPLTPHSPFVRSSSLHIDTSAVENSNITDSTPSPLPGPVLVAPTDPTATASGPVPGKYQYFLLEYERCVSSRWGDVPVRLLKRYPAGDILALRTDTRAHKKGLEFTVILRRNTSTAPTSGTANESMKTTTGEGAVGKVSMQDFPSPVSRQPSAATGQSAKSTAGEEIEEKGFKSLVKKAKPGGRFAAVVKAEQKAQQAQQETSAAAAEPGGSATVTTAPAQTPAPIVTEQEEPPVIETRWTRLLRRNSSKKDNTVVDTAASAPPTLPPPVTVETSHQPNGTSAGNNSADVAANDEEKQNEEEEDPSEDEKVDDSDPEEEGEIDDNDSQADAATSIGGGSEFGDFYYRDGTLPPGVNEADLRSGKKINKKDFIKLKLKAPTPDERLQWVQIIHSIAAPTMYINTTSY
eukprot:gene9770-11478_t